MNFIFKVVAVTFFICPLVSCVSTKDKQEDLEPEVTIFEKAQVIPTITSTYDFFNYSEHNTGVQYEKPSEEESKKLDMPSTSNLAPTIFFNKQGRIGHIIDDTRHYHFSFQCLTGSINIEKYIGSSLPSYKVVNCTGQTIEVEITNTHFLELNTKYLDSNARLGNVKFLAINHSQ